MAELAREPLGAVVQAAADHEAEPDPGAEGDDGEVLRLPPRAEEVLGHGEGVDVVVHAHGKAGRPAEGGGDVDVVPAEDGGEPARAGGRVHVPADADADAEGALAGPGHRVQEAADELGDGGQRLLGARPVHGRLLPGDHLGPEIGQDPRDGVGADLDAHRAQLLDRHADDPPGPATAGGGGGGLGDVAAVDERLEGAGDGGLVERGELGQIGAGERLVAEDQGEELCPVRVLHRGKVEGQSPGCLHTHGLHSIGRGGRRLHGRLPAGSARGGGAAPRRPARSSSGSRRPRRSGRGRA
ncbi:hypothetical protein SAT01_35200 [Sinomonas atrocyanea]|nr:hypothetical protein SAT01_35200 [Sinomonas atrocyanea]GGG76821.1 hypothetical protein GCM10007172_32190 [Sinomonas atrocyanea]